MHCEPEKAADSLGISSLAAEYCEDIPESTAPLPTNAQIPKQEDLRGSVRKSFSALCSAASQNLASVTVRHSLSEAVLLLSVKLLRLICSQHTKPSFRVYNLALYNYTLNRSGMSIVFLDFD